MLTSPYGDFDLMGWLTRGMTPTQPQMDKADPASQMLAALFGPLGSFGPGNGEAGALIGASLPDSSQGPGPSLGFSAEPISLLRYLLSFVSPFLQTSGGSMGS